jgi:hypothetical protein
MEVFCPKVGKPVQAPARWCARLRKPLISMAMGLGIMTNTVACSPPREVGQCLERDAGQQPPTLPEEAGIPQKRLSCGALLNDDAQMISQAKKEENLWMQDIGMQNKEAVKNLGKALGYWQKKDREGTPRLLVGIKKILAKNGVILETGIERDMRSRIENLRVGKNVFPSPLSISLRGFHEGGIVFVSFNDYSDSKFASANGRKESMSILAHEIVHLLENLPEEYAKLPQECWKPVSTISEGITEYMIEGITAYYFGRGTTWAYYRERCIIARLAKDRNALEALIKVFFMPRGERQARKGELNESLEAIGKRMDELEITDCSDEFIIVKGRRFPAHLTKPINNEWLAKAISTLKELENLPWRDAECKENNEREGTPART